MKKLLLLALILLTFTSKAQTLFGSSGGSVSNPDFQLDFSIGEPITSEAINPDLRLNIGYQQPWYDFFLAQKPSQEFHFELHPNPFTGEFQFLSNSAIERYSLFDAHGKKVFHSASVSAMSFLHSDRNLPKGWYSLHIVFENGNLLNTKVINH